MKTAIIPAFVFAICSTVLFAQNPTNSKDLSASIKKDEMPKVNKRNSFYQKQINKKPLIDKENAVERNSVSSTNNVTVKAFPNPFVNELSINVNEVAGTETYEAILVDLQGRKVFSQELISKKDKLNLSAIAKGIYILHVQKNGRTILQEKVVKE